MQMCTYMYITVCAYAWESVLGMCVRRANYLNFLNQKLHYIDNLFIIITINLLSTWSLFICEEPQIHKE